MTAKEFRQQNAYGSIRNYTPGMPECENCKWHTETASAIKYADSHDNQVFVYEKWLWCKACNSRGFRTYVLHHCNAWKAGWEK